MNADVCEESVAFPSGDLQLSGVLAYPEQSTPRYAALICAPHPNFAGNMENNLVVALAREFSPHAMTLRFDYRGIGKSDIRLPADTAVFDYWDELEQSKNYAAPLADVAAAAAALDGFSHGLPLALLGYSFGAIVGMKCGLQLPGVSALAGIAPPLAMFPFDFLRSCQVPCLLLSGEDDFVFSAGESARLKSVWSAWIEQVIVKSEDHFFRDTEAAVCARVRTFVEHGLNL